MATFSPHIISSHYIPPNQQYGAGIGDVVRSANKFLRKHKIISKGAEIASLLGVPGASHVRSISSTLGYGRKKKKTGTRRRKKMSGRGIIRT